MTNESRNIVCRILSQTVGTILISTISFDAKLLPSIVVQHAYHFLCHTCFDWNKKLGVSFYTGSLSKSTASYLVYEDKWDNWTENDSPQGTPDSHTWGGRLLPLIPLRTPKIPHLAMGPETSSYILDSGVYRIVF